MDPLVRRRLPPSVRSLLTDIGPKEEWIETETEPEAVARDGILLPSRGAASEQEEFLSPAKAKGAESGENGENTGRDAVCMMCKCKPSCYTCPRCNLRYCGLACYQSPDHSTCSEAFYKDSVLEELKDMGKTEDEQKRKMQEILLELRQKAERTDGGMESVLKEAGIVSCDTGEEEEEGAEKVQVVELLSRLAELQQSGDEDTTEIEAILRKLGEIGGEELLSGDAEEDVENAEVDSGLAERLSGMNLDKLSEEELWEVLNGKEKEMFVDMMKSGALGELVPLWKPWWEEHDSGSARALVEEVSKSPATTENKPEEEILLEQSNTGAKSKKVNKKKNKKSSKGISADSTVPQISAKIPKLSTLCANPSPLISYGLVNALYGYSFTLCFLNGDTDSLMFEFCDMTLALSEALSSNKVFNSIQEATNCGDNLIQSGGYLDKDDPQALARAIEAVAHILTGRDRKDTTGYCLSALSQLRSVLSQARSALSKEGAEGIQRKKYFLASKKCEFFQAWVMDSTPQIHKLAVELWHEHSKRQSVRSVMEKDKKVVEETLKKGKMRENRTMIEELS